MTLRVLVADDELLARRRLARLLAVCEDVTLVGEAADGDEVLARVRAGGVDVVLLDIRMPRLSGVEAMQIWPEGGPYVIFCTAHPDHAVDAFAVGAIDYLLKPIEPARLARALDRARSWRAAPDAWRPIPVTTRDGVVLVDPATVTHAVLEHDLVTLHTTRGELLTDYSLQALEERMPAGRLERVHRRALVNLEHVSRLEPLVTGGYLAHLPGGQVVPVSRQAARALRRRLGL